MHGGSPIEDEENFPPGKVGEFKRKVWDLFEKPHTSIGARIVAVFSVLCIIASTIILTLNTLPVFLESPDKILGDYWIFAIIEMLYMSWFTVEFFARCCSNQSLVKCKSSSLFPQVPVVPEQSDFFLKSDELDRPAGDHSLFCDSHSLCGRICGFRLEPK